MTIDSDPFVNSAEGDFRLKADTSPIDYGRVIDGITDGYSDENPDVGAYELNGDEWNAGIDWDPEQGPANLGDYGLPGENSIVSAGRWSFCDRI